MLSCFFQGFCNCLLRKMANARQRRRRLRPGLNGFSLWVRSEPLCAPWLGVWFFFLQKGERTVNTLLSWQLYTSLLQYCRMPASC